MQKLNVHYSLDKSTEVSSPKHSKSSSLRIHSKQESSDSILCKLAYNVIWHLLTSLQSSQTLVSLEGELAEPGRGVERSRHGGGCLRSTKPRKKPVSLFLTATVSLGWEVMNPFHTIRRQFLLWGQQSWHTFFFFFFFLKKGPNNYCKHTQMMPPVKCQKHETTTGWHRLMSDQCTGWTETYRPNQFLLWLIFYDSAQLHIQSEQHVASYSSGLSCSSISDLQLHVHVVLIAPPCLILFIHNFIHLLTQNKGNGKPHCM